jgi:hypothetical protein
MVPRHTGHVGSSPVSGLLDEKGTIGVSPGLPVISGLECRSEYVVNESVYCSAENRYGSATCPPLWTNNYCRHRTIYRCQRRRAACCARQPRRPKIVRFKTKQPASVRSAQTSVGHRRLAQVTGRTSKTPTRLKLRDSQDEKASLICCKCDDLWRNRW